MRTHMLKPTLLACLACTAAAAEEGVNRFPGDGSFEVGSARWLGGRVVEAADAPHGLRVLELSRPYNHDGIHYDLLEPGREYVFSVDARSLQGPGKAWLALNHTFYGTVAPPATLELGPAWKRFVVRIPPQPQRRAVYLSVRLPPSATIQLDGMMLESGAGSGTYRPGAVPLVGVSPTGAPGGILHPDDPLPVLRTGAANPTGQAIAGDLVVETTDFAGRIVAKGSVPVRLAPGASAVSEYRPLESMRGGYYVVKAVLRDGAGAEVAADAVAFGVAPRPRAIDPRDSFFGLHPDAHRVEIAAMQRIGVKWVRHFYDWSYLEAKQGEVRSLDDQSYARHGMSVCATLKLVDAPPRWTGVTAGRLDDPKALEAFLVQVTQRNQGGVQAWEIENEPDINYRRLLDTNALGAATYYGEIAATATGILNRLTPGIPVATMSVSGGADYDAFFTIAQEHCRVPSQIAAPHPYTGARWMGPLLPNPVAPDSYLRGRALKYGAALPGKRLWMGEVGWAYDAREPLGSWSHRTYSNFMARAILLMKSVPEVERMFWFKAQGCYEGEGGYYHYGLWQSEFEPLPAAVFYAGLASRLEGATAYKPVFESDLRAYTYRAKDGTPFAAVWRSKGGCNTVEIPAVAGRLRVTDLFGAPVETVAGADGTVSMPVGDTPVWVEVAGASADQLVALLGAVSVDMQPLSVTVFHYDGTTVAGYVTGNLPRPAAVELAAAGATGAGFELAPNARKSFQLAYPASDPSRTIAIEARCAGKVVEYRLDAAALVPCHALTGASPAAFPDLLAAPGAIRLAGREAIYPPDPGIPWKGPGDLSAVFNTGCDERFFSFAADVTDPVHHQTVGAGGRAWEGDSIQMAFDTRHDAEAEGFEYGKDDKEFMAWLGPDGPQLSASYSPGEYTGGRVKGATVDIRRVDGVTRYRVAIPWSELSQLAYAKGRLFRFNFIVNQNNGQGRTYWLGLSQGIGEMKYPFLYRSFVIAP